MTPEGVFFCWWGGAERDFVNSANLSQITHRRSPSFSVHRVQLHLIRKGFLGWKQFLALQVTVHHKQNRGIIVHFPHDSRYLGLTRKQAGVMTAVSRYDLKIAVICGAYQNGD